MRAIQHLLRGKPFERRVGRGVGQSKACAGGSPVTRANASLSFARDFARHQKLLLAGLQLHLRTQFVDRRRDAGGMLIASPFIQRLRRGRLPSAPPRPALPRQ